MIKKIRQIYCHNKILKINALILGYCTWNYLYNFCPFRHQIEIPICFYNQTNQYEIESEQDKIYIEILAKGKTIKCLKDLAFHINAKDIPIGQSYIQPDEKNLFLPTNVKMLNYKPNIVGITKREIKILDS